MCLRATSRGGVRMRSQRKRQNETGGHAFVSLLVAQHRRFFGRVGFCHSAEWAESDTCKRHTLCITLVPVRRSRRWAPLTTHLLSLSLRQQHTLLLTPTRSIIDLYISFTSCITAQGHPEEGEITVASLTDLRRSSILESFGVFSLGGRRAAVAGLASGSGFSVIGVVGVELTAGFSSFTAGSVDGTGAGAGAGAGA